MFAFLRNFFAFMGMALVTGLCSTGAAHASDAASAPTHHRVVFVVNVNDQHIWNGLFGNFKNIQADLGSQNVDIEVVAHGDGLAILRDDSLVAGKVAQAISDGVKFVACQNTMKSHKLTKDDMLPNIGYVPAGIVELMKRQEEGWSYIKP